MTHEQMNTLPLWRRMPVISLDEMSAIKLMNRVDTKYVLNEAQCMELLERATADYFVQTIGDCRVCRYVTLYYDTDDWRMYTLHHDRRLTRQKIRTRTYVESGVSFVEIKNKNNKGRTKKRRIPIPQDDFGDVTCNGEATEFLRGSADYAPEAITPSLMTRFERITLVNRSRTERLTVDLNLQFVNVRARGDNATAVGTAGGGCADIVGACRQSVVRLFGNGRSAGNLRSSGTADSDVPDGGAVSVASGGDGVTVAVDGMVIVELKQNGLAPSPMKRILGRMRIRPLKVSKYCLGTALSNPLVKSNRFKDKIRRIVKIVNTQNNNL